MLLRGQLSPQPGVWKWGAGYTVCLGTCSPKVKYASLGRLRELVLVCTLTWPLLIEFNEAQLPSLFDEVRYL